MNIAAWAAWTLAHQVICLIHRLGRSLWDLAEVVALSNYGVLYLLVVHIWINDYSTLSYWLIGLYKTLSLLMAIKGTYHVISLWEKCLCF